jgi:alanine dehydrogenase
MFILWQSEGVNTYPGKITYAGVAESQGKPWHQLTAAV